MHKITPKSKEDRDNCMTENKYTHDVFISFSFNDQTVAEYIVNTLSSMYEISCWICTRDIAGGSRYKRLIPEAIDNAQVVVFLQSSSSIASKEVPKEIGLAMDADKIIIPFKLDSAPLTGDLRYDLYGVEYIDATVPSFDERIKDLAMAIKKVLKPASNAAAPTEPQKQDSGRQLEEIRKFIEMQEQRKANESPKPQYEVPEPMSSLCKCCGGELIFKPDSNQSVCEYCGSRYFHVAEKVAEYKVLLTDIGPNKPFVMKVVREITNLGLSGVSKLISDCPAVIVTGVSLERANSVKDMLVREGAKAEIKVV